MLWLLDYRFGHGRHRTHRCVNSPLGQAVQAGLVEVEGDPADLATLMLVLGPVDPDFAIVTP